MDKPAFAMRMTMASLEAQKEFSAPDMRQFLSSRSGTAGICRMAMVWTGDNRTEWKTLRFNHYMGLTMSLSGLYLFGHDIGGFAGLAPTKELFLRWLQHGVFTPRFTIHSWNDDAQATMPWSYEDLMPAVKEIFAFRSRILPYLYDAMYRAHTLHEPILRPLIYDDPTADAESDLFLVGESLLAVCVFDPGVAELTIRLPQSEHGWYDESGDWLMGETETTLACPAACAPRTLMKGGSVFLEDASIDPEKNGSTPFFTIYAQDSGTFSREYFFDDGVSFAYLKNDCVRIAFAVECLPDCVRVRFVNRGNHRMTPEVRLVDRLHRRLELVNGGDA